MAWIACSGWNGMNFDTHFNAETAWNYRSGLPDRVSPELLAERMASVLEDVGEYMGEWRIYIVLECWTRLEQPEEHRRRVRDWLRALKRSSNEILWSWGSLRSELEEKQQWLLLESMPIGNWATLIRAQDLPKDESHRLRMMWWQPQFWVNRKSVELFAPAAFQQWDELMKEEEWTIPRLNGLVEAMGTGVLLCELPEL